MKRLTLLLLLLSPLYGQAAEDRLGRLFLTPAERTNLDYLRRTSKPPERIQPSAIAGEEVEPVASTPAQPPAVVTVQGYVKRSDGKGTVWVNRQPVQEKTTQGEISVGKLGTRDNRVSIKLPGSDKPVSLKAGQAYDPVSGMIVDNPGQLPESTEIAPSQEKTAKPTPASEAPKKP